MEFYLGYILIFFCIYVIKENKYIAQPVLWGLLAMLAISITFRDIKWADTIPYIQSFRYTPELQDYSIYIQPKAYSEKGFFLLVSLCKTLSNDFRLYFFVVATLSCWLLYKNLSKYSLIPLVGFLIYISRFVFARHYIQIRAGLSILIVVYAIQFIESKEWKKYFALIILAISLHTSSILAIPMYWIGQINFSNKQIWIIIAVAFLIAVFMDTFVKTYVTNLSAQYNFGTTYTSDNSEHTKGIGLLNPIIYLQVLILSLYTYFRSSLAKVDNYYIVKRNAYLYSTIILIIFSSFSALSGRTSTIYATLEIFLIPALLQITPKKLHFFVYVLVGTLAAVFLYAKNDREIDLILDSFMISL